AALSLVDLAGSVALLLWGVHMIQSGIQRAFGPHLRRVLGAALGSRGKAFFGGLGITAVLQSVERGVAASLAERAKRNLASSAEGTAEIGTMLRRLATNVRTAAAVFMTGDVRAARELLGEKEVFRDLETRATEAHFARIRVGRVESVETSALHLDLLRDLKRINAHLAAAAYPVLEQRGELLSSRLRQDG
ncbi:MAG TPA: PhoU domain-containing protein, partial [Stellaceae bacterium]|nr:PhoU domain-containing protein [Stellaceae bacterium]